MKYKLKRGEIEEFAILDDSLKFDVETFTFNCKVDSRMNLESKQIAVVLTVNFLIKGETKLKIKSVLYFQISDETWHEIDQGANKYILSKENLLPLTVIAVGSTRGMIIAKTANTIYSNVIFPVFDVRNLVKDDVRFDITSS